MRTKAEWREMNATRDPYADPTKTKRCGGYCKRERPVTEFGLFASFPDGLNNWCKECVREEGARRREKLRAVKNGEAIECTGAEAGLSRDEQVRIALGAMVASGGSATTDEIRKAVEERMESATLSKQGKASLASFLSSRAVEAGLVRPGGERGVWTITPEGREFLEGEDEVETTVDASGFETVSSKNTVPYRLFELHCQKIVKAMYPNHVWLDQGLYKRGEFGLDLIGTEVGSTEERPKKIGVQVKLHKADSTPTDLEWTKFLAGAFRRRVSTAIFITTGRLRDWQRDAANEAGVLVIEGRSEVDRISDLYGIEPFDENGEDEEAA